ncbi:GumC family protein [Jannaschia ovalis]|uniref:Lipopolysaccharide biosynthesis protein n=1 Tax=Jannaschia ovalis TaxID=3038773 RepID=A0ABY8L7B1_9RHOB|nr:lipopolysaccharide biosynthesis protein [Jannaschia sp. GRR-S6-38]WGH77273.1 lipopolysaccharide biosynthesis protein [Jannaschia sp. GRR-S6-38]
MSDVLFYLSLFKRRLPWFLLALFVCTGSGLGVAISLPPVYEAGARLVVEAEKIPDELAASTVQTAAYEHLQIIEQRVLSREALLDIANRLNVYEGERPAPDEIVEDLRERIVFTIDGAENRRDTERATMLDIRFEAGSAVMAASVANELVTRVMAEDVEMRTSVARQTLEFFDQEVSRLQQELSASGATLMAFRQEHEEALPGTRELQLSRVADIEEELSRIARESDALKRERERLTRLHETVRRREAGSNLRASSYEGRQIVALRETLADLPQGDPGIPEIEDRIARLSRRLDADRNEGAGGRSAYHRHRDEIDGKLAEAAELRRLLLEELERLRGGLARAPVKAAQLASLEEDHQNLRALYNQAVEAKAMAETGDAIEALSKGQRVAVIEQAAIPRKPARPNREAVALAGSGLGVAIGLMIVVLLELRLGFLRRPVDLQRHLGIVPLATLPILAGPETLPADAVAKRRIRPALAVAFALLGLTLAGAAVGGWLPAPDDLLARAARLLEF